MLLLTSFEEVLRFIFLGMRAKSIQLPQTGNDWRFAYQGYLVSMQPDCFWLRSSNETLQESIKSNTNGDSEVVRNLINRFWKKISEDKTSNSEIQNQILCKYDITSISPHVEDYISDGISRLREISEDYFNFLDMFIEMIFVGGSEIVTGGTISDTIGVIWLNPHSNFSADDTSEMLIHELTHSLLFLDEWVHDHYDYSKIRSESSWCRSAILRTNRPVDKVVHSIIVSAEICLYRKHFSVEPKFPMAHPPTDEILDSIIYSINDLRARHSNTGAIHPRIWFLLEQTEQSIKNVA